MEQGGPDLTLKDEKGVQAEGRQERSEGMPTRRQGRLMQEGPPQRGKVFRVVRPQLISLQLQILKLLPCSQLASFCLVQLRTQGQPFQSSLSTWAFTILLVMSSASIPPAARRCWRITETGFLGPGYSAILFFTSHFSVAVASPNNA